MLVTTWKVLVAAAALRLPAGAPRTVPPIAQLGGAARPSQGYGAIPSPNTGDDGSSGLQLRASALERAATVAAADSDTIADVSADADTDGESADQSAGADADADSDTNETNVDAALDALDAGRRNGTLPFWRYVERCADGSERQWAAVGCSRNYTLAWLAHELARVREQWRDPRGTRVGVGTF